MYHYGESKKFPFFLVQTDGQTAVTATAPTIKISKDGSGTQADATNTATHVAGGHWYVTLTDAELQAGFISLLITHASALSVFVTIPIIQKGVTNWYVDASATGDDTGRDWTNAFTTVQEALDVADLNDTIYIKNGTYNEQIDVDVAGLTLVGQSTGSTVITYNSGDTVTVSAENVTLINLKCVASAETGNGAGLYASAPGTTVKECYLDGKYAGLRTASGIRNVNVMDSNIIGTYYAAYLDAPLNHTYQRNLFYSVGTHSTDNEFSAIRINSTVSTPEINLVHTTFASCLISAVRTGISATNKRTIGVVASGTTILKDCRVSVYTSNVSYGGAVYGLLGDDHTAESPDYAGYTTLVGGNVAVKNLGGNADTKALRTLSAVSTIDVVGCTFASSTMVGTLNSIIDDIDAVPQTLLDLSHDAHTTAGSIGAALENLYEMFDAPDGGTGKISDAAGAEIGDDVDTLLTRLTAARADDLDQIDNLTAKANSTNTLVAALPSAAAINTAVENGQVGDDTGVIRTSSAQAAADIAHIKNRHPYGSVLTTQGGSTTTSLIVTAESGVVAANLLNAIIAYTGESRTSSPVRVTAVSGTAPNLTLTLSPALPATPITGDLFVVGPQYLNTGSL